MLDVMTPTTTEELHSGDHLTRDEFERRYAAMHDRKAELIEGVVYVASPVSTAHGDLHALVMLWLGTYAAHVAGFRASDNSSVRIDDLNEPQPDASLRRTDHPVDGIYVAGTPPFVVEVAYTSAAIDLHKKRELYQRTGCHEYVVVTLAPFGVHWFANAREGIFTRLAPENGTIRSRAFPGLWLDVEALGRLDGAAVLATLQQGMSVR